MLTLFLRQNQVLARPFLLFSLATIRVKIKTLFSLFVIAPRASGVFKLWEGLSEQA
jgi:hypothetical protein